MRITRLVVATPLLLVLTASSQVGRQSGTKPEEVIDRTSIKVATFPDKDGALTTKTITGSRDMALYENGSHFDCRQVTIAALKRPREEGARIATALERARTFIWDHWETKKRGYIRVTFNSVDATSTSHIFIEPDSSGVWQVTWRIVRHNNEVDDVDAIRVLRWKKMDRQSVLIFASADGKEIERL